MSRENQAKRVLENFDDITSQEILELLNQFLLEFQSPIVQDYLKGKLKVISNTDDEKEKKKLCKNLKPYFDWYLQGQ